MPPLLILLISLSTAVVPAEETITPQFTRDLPNVPGKQLTAVVVEYPPGAKSESHRHAASAFIYALVVEGSIRSQLEGEPAPRTYRVGQSWIEPPGAHHVISENADLEKPAKLLAIFIVTPGQVLTTVDGKER